MTQFKGTKGKWELKKGIQLNGVFCNDKQIVVCHGQDSLKNALLISKAPEMLEMLIECKEALSRIGHGIIESKIEKIIKEATEL